MLGTETNLSSNPFLACFFTDAVEPCVRRPPPGDHRRTPHSQAVWTICSRKHARNGHEKILCSSFKDSSGRKPVGARNVSGRKASSFGEITKPKAHAVVKRFRRLPPIDFLETHARIPSPSSLRLLVAPPLQCPPDLLHFDIEQAFSQLDSHTEDAVNNIITSLRQHKEAGNGVKENGLPSAFRLRTLRLRGGK